MQFHSNSNTYRSVPICILLGLCLLISCKKDTKADGDLGHIRFETNPYSISVPSGFPQPQIPGDNQLTHEGVSLGRMLFFDPILSIDSSQSCSSCHLPQNNFTDNLATSEGVDMMAGRRSAMPLVNLAFSNVGLFWDGRSPSLEEQALLPVEDPIELHDTWPNVESKLKRSTFYPEAFRKAFGITNTDEISKELAVKAIAQFERSIVSSGDSKWDQVQRNDAFFTDDELAGFDLFFDVTLPDSECGHCHNAPLFTTNEFFNNGIENVASLDDFPDKGLGEVTLKTNDNGKFKIPSLRNIVHTAPYMHDGRFATLEEVLDHYNSGGHFTDNRHPLMRELNLTEDHKRQLIAFLNTLTDNTLLNDPRYQNPFE